MKIKWFDRDLEINKNRINVDNFKNEKTLIGMNFNRKQMKFKDYKNLLVCLIMPYRKLDDMFIRGKL